MPFKSIKGVMDEWKGGQLHSGSSSGPVVRTQPQAVAIALSEQRRAQGSAPARQTAPRQVHPVLQQRAQMVSAAHRHLSKAIPGFTKLPMRDQMIAHQRYVTQQLGKRGK